jgi:hypothetical protein
MILGRIALADVVDEHAGVFRIPVRVAFIAADLVIPGPGNLLFLGKKQLQIVQHYLLFMSKGQYIRNIIHQMQRY